jgi:hypothetical protein
MPSAASIIAKVNKALTKVGPMARRSLLRVTTTIGGDALTGVGIAYSTADTAFAPQPFYKQLGKREAMYLSSSGLQLVADDYKFIFPVGQITRAMLQAINIQIVLYDANGYEELKIIYVDSAMYGGSDVAITVVARSVGWSTLTPVMMMNGALLVLMNGNTLAFDPGTTFTPPASGGSVTLYRLSPAPNGSVTTFAVVGLTTSVSTSAFLVRNGIVLTQGAGNDYTVSGINVTFAVAPQTGDSLSLWQ